MSLSEGTSPKANTWLYVGSRGQHSMATQDFTGIQQAFTNSKALQFQRNSIHVDSGARAPSWKGVSQQGCLGASLLPLC